MKKTLQYLKSTITTIVLLVGTTTSCYGSKINNIFTNNLGEQAQGLQLTNATPEPEVMLLLGIGLLLLAAVSRKGKKSSNESQ